MIWRRFHHGHAMGAGVVIGILLTRHSWLLVVAGFALGFVTRDLYMAARWVARWFAHRKLRAESALSRRYSRIPY